MTLRGQLATAALALAAALLVGGCEGAGGGESGAPGFCAEEALPLCDIRSPSCHEAAIAVLQCLRGPSTAPRPKVIVIDEEELARRLRQDFGPPSERLRRFERAYQELGVLARGVSLLDAQTQLSLETISALFSREERAVYVVDRGVPFDARAQVALLIHELVHAVQHEEHDLDRVLASADTTEALQRVRMAIEGEARYYQLEALRWRAGDRPGLDLAWEEQLAGHLRVAGEDLEKSPWPFLLVHRRFPYVLGARHDAAAWQRGGDEAVRAVLPELPLSTTFVDDPWDEAAPAERLEVAPCPPPPAPAGLEPPHHDEMGPLFLYAYLRIPGGWDHDRAWQLVTAWQRDDLHVYGAPDGRVAAVWRVHLARGSDEVAAAAEFAGHLARASGVWVTLQVLAEGLDPWSWEAEPAGCAFP